MLRPDFDTLLPRLVAQVEAGRLVPFIGSGMSRPACTDWQDFVRALEQRAGLADEPALAAQTSREDLVRRANRAVRTLKGGRPDAFADSVRAGLLAADAPASLPAQTQALARIAWPLVLSTNYDNCYAAACAAPPHEREIGVVGRSPEDCQRVLSSLSTAGRPLLWALQGYLHDLPDPAQAAETTRALEQQLVVGHEEYRRVTYREPHFRRAFAEVFRQRSLLFLGAGLQESYLQELFGEVLEFYGPGARTHYAFIQQGEVDAAFMLARFQIVVVEYGKGEHGRVAEQLNRLADAAHRPAQAPVAWSWGRIVAQAGERWSSVPELEVVRGPLPEETIDDECLAVSAGGSGSKFYFSPGIREVMKGWGVHDWMPDRLDLPYLGRFGDRPVFAVRARDEKDERSLAHIHDAALALFEKVAPQFRCIHLQLLATGGIDKTGVTAQEWQVRRYPERFSFVQTLRAWAEWRRRAPANTCRLVLHVVVDSVFQAIASGRIDVLELLSCTDMRFFVEVIGAGGELERRLFQTRPDLPLAEVVADLQLAPAEWSVRVSPPPDASDPWLALDGERLDRALQALGVVPGSTLHFRRPDTAAS